MAAGHVGHVREEAMNIYCRWCSTEMARDVQWSGPDMAVVTMQMACPSRKCPGGWGRQQTVTVGAMTAAMPGSSFMLTPQRSRA